MKHIVYADLDTIVFEGREQSYGAYQMRRKYNRLLGRSAIIAFLLFLSVTGLPKVIDWIVPGGEIEKTLIVEKMIPLDALPAPETTEEVDPVEPPPPPPKKTTPPPAQRAQIAFAVIEPAPEEQVSPDETIRDMNELLEVDTAIIGTRDVAGIADDGTGDPDWDNLPFGDGDGEPEILKQEEEPSDTDFVIVEEMPRPVNMDQLRDLIGYPSQAVEATIEGKVIVRVLVDELGSYRKHVVLKNPHAILTKAVEKQLKHLQFTPGIQASKPIKVWVNIPFEFILNQR